ncbi:PAS domain-containing protein [Rhodobacter sp. SGA-6-6]|uniref:sensor histidine kinase n=1 Tax=Rhodobacter sp. SGA-6-6 TaxID=2710882 RepID=UPI0013EB72C6|nr:ATP-binding protein [Rhodobacter sp. SGA-6-6]NGM47671.1 PAS domain-containing protein [Rhodobacter sp. SGA-6-6]
MSLPHPSPDPARPTLFSDEAWVEVLSAMDRTYADLVDYQERLERQNAELQEMRTFLTAILSSVSDVLIVAGRTGQVEQVSRSVLTLTGRPEAQVVNAGLVELFAEAQRPVLAALLQGVREQRRSASLECDLLTAEGMEPLELSAAPRLDERGRVDGYVLTGRPLGALRKAYAGLSESHDALKTAQAFLVRNEKLASLGRLLAGVAHELNNPISFVYANTHALERYAGKFETYFAKVQAGASREELIALRQELRLDREVANLREAINGARDGAERVRDIVEDLRRLSSDGAGEKVAFDLAETARTAGQWVMRGMKQPVTLDLSSLRRVEVLGRRGHIQQVVMNLIQNSADALEDRADGRIRLSLGAEGDRAVLVVADNGPGVPEAVRASIFDPFFTTKPVGRGTGLGLSISHKIAEEHGGSLALIEADEGAAFRLDLPLAGGVA